MNVLATSAAERSARDAWLVAIAPLLVAADTLARGLALAVALLAVSSAAWLGAAAWRGPATQAGRLAITLLLAAGWLALVQLLFRVLLYDLYLALGASLALGIASVSVLDAATGRASGRRMAADGLLPALAIAALGALREMLGQGTLLSRQVPPLAEGLALLATPAGAFILLGLGAAGLEALAARRAAGTSSTS